MSIARSASSRLHVIVGSGEPATEGDELGDDEGDSVATDVGGMTGAAVVTEGGGVTGAGDCEPEGTTDSPGVREGAADSP